MPRAIDIWHSSRTSFAMPFTSWLHRPHSMHSATRFLMQSLHRTQRVFTGLGAGFHRQRRRRKILAASFPRLLCTHCLLVVTTSLSVLSCDFGGCSLLSSWTTQGFCAKAHSVRTRTVARSRPLLAWIINTMTTTVMVYWRGKGEHVVARRQDAPGDGWHESPFGLPLPRIKLSFSSVKHFLGGAGGLLNYYSFALLF